MKTRWALRFLFFLIGSYLAVGMVLRTEWAGARICAQGAGLLSRFLGQPVVLSKCDFDPWRTEVAIQGIHFGVEEGSFSARNLEVRFSLFSIARGFSISKVSLDSPRLVIDLRGAEGEETAPTSRAASCLGPVEKLPIGEAVLRNASLSLHLPHGGSLHLRGVDVEALSEGRGRSIRLEVEGGSFAGGEGPPIELEGIEALVRLFPAEEKAEIESFVVRALESELRVQGRVDEICAPRLSLRSELRADLERLGAHFLPDWEKVGGSLGLSASLEGPVGDLRARTELQLRAVRFEDMEPGDLDGKIALEGGSLEIEELVWPFQEGRAVVEGRIELTGRMRADLGVRTESLPFHKMMARLPVKNTPVMMAIDSTHRLRGPLRGGLALEGRSSLRLHDFRVRNAPWHAQSGSTVVEVPGAALLEGRVRITEDGVQFSGGQASFGRESRLEIDAHLSFEDAKGLQILARSQSFTLADVAGHVADIPLGGKGMLEASIRGPYPDPMIEGSIDFEGARLWSGLLGRVRAEVVSRPSEYELEFVQIEGQLEETGYRGEVALVLGDEPTIEGQVALGPGGRLAEVWNSTRDLLSPLEWLAGNLDGRIDSVEARFHGELPNIEGEARLRSRRVRLMDRPFDSLEARVVLPDISRLEVEELVLTRSGGRAIVVGEARFPEDETPSVQASLSAEGLPIRDLLGEFGEWADLEGVVASNATLVGPIDQLNLQGDLRGAELAASGVPLEATHLTMETQDDQVLVRGALAGAGMLAAAVRLAEDLPYDATLFIDVPRLEAFLPARTRIEGRVRGQASATGTLAEVAASSGNITLDEFVLGLAGYQVESRSEVSLGFSGPAFVLYGLDLEGENTSLSLHGNRSIDDVLDLQAQGSFDARLVGTLLPDLEHPAGVISMKASITGTTERPIVIGSAEIERGSFRHRDLPVSVQSLVARLAFSQNQLVVQEANMQVNGGPATLSGTVSLRGLSPDLLDLVFQARGMSWRMPAEWPVVASGRIGITGPWGERILLSGEAKIERLRWLQDLDIEKMILDVRREVQAPPPADASEWVRLDIDLIGGEDMRVETEHLRARLRFVGGQGRESGRLRLTGSNLNPALLGSVEVLDGVALFRGNEYRVTNGMVDFRERDRIDPAFDITAETEVREYRIAAHAYGRLEDFQVDLHSEPLLAQADILTLLTFGITSQDLDSGGGAAFSGASLAADALLTVSGFDEHVKKWLPRTPLLMDPDISVTSQFSELTGQMEPMAVFEAKVFTDRLKLQAATPFATTKGRRASAEMRVSDRLSTQLSWQNEAVGYSSGDLGFDLKLRWEWE